MLDFSRTASYEITVIRLSVRPSLSFLKIGSLVFSDIVHGNSCPWYLVSNKARFFLGGGMAARIWAQNEVFRHFIEFGS